jgi:hypothetical protein
MRRMNHESVQDTHCLAPHREERKQDAHNGLERCENRKYREAQRMSSHQYDGEAGHER